uniref:Uncharacterized protein n=1 Tax=Avena sativa TaxID=4498 RepID=A0ACD5XH98_AVESA
MYKLGGRGGGRGGGGGGTKRPPAPHGRGRGGSASGPPHRGRAAAAASPAAQPEGREEAFSLESSGPPAFAALIRLTPDLIDEIRRAEEAGGAARIMFNSNINPAENIIDVDGKEFNFTWSSEPGLCDIYEERQSGEGGNGLLMERGSAWRKVNVQRILDESAKNTVKMRSEEAERISKSRKSIVLDPTNPSVKIQAKSMTAAAVEGNMRRNKWNQNKEHFKKNQAAIIPTKSISKVKLPSNSITKGSISTSPAPSPEQPGSSIPSYSAGSDANHEVIVPFDLKKEESSKVEKARPNRISQGLNRRASSVSASVDDNAIDLRGLLISILSENPKGMNLKALEKAVADTVPNASKKIESIIKNVANYQAPGRYVLKPELEVETSKHDASGSGRTIDENIEETAPSLQIDDPDIFEKIEIGGSPVSAAGDEKVNGSDGKAGTSSESGSDSDSDSDSSGSGSDSGSQSRSAASGSGSSSDSDSDASSSSNEGSDAFVDITSDDNKADTSGRKVADELKLSSSPRDLLALDGDDEQIDIGTNLDYTSTSSHIDLNNFNIDNDEAAYTTAATENIGGSKVNMPSEILGSKNMESARSDPSIVDGKYPANKTSDKDNLFDDPLAASSENLPIEEAIQFTKQDSSRRKSTSKDGTNHVPSRTSEKGAKATLKRGSDNDNATTKPESAKKAKVDIAYSGATGSSSEHRQNLPPDKHVNERLSKETGNVGWDAHTDPQLQDSTPMKGRPPASGNVQKINQSPKVSIQTMHSEGTQEKIAKASSKKKVDKMQKPSNSMDGNLGKGYAHVDDHFNDSDDSAARKRGRHGGSFVEGKMHKRSKDANIDANSINIAKGARGNVNNDVVMSLPEFIETNGEPSILQRNSVDKSPPAKKVLQREQSELELGELREGSLENDIERTRRQFERNSSSKSLDGKATNVDNPHPSMNNRKVAVSSFHGQRKPSPQEFSTSGNINQEGMPRKTLGYDFDNRSQQRVNVSQGRQLSRTGNPESENILYPDRLLEKTGKRETEISQGGVLNHVDPKKKKTTPKLPQNGTKNGIEHITRKSISPAENEQSRNNSVIETDIGRKRRDSSSDEDNFFFSKYDKEEPELKGPIKDFSQYQDYVQEYNEKYEVYSYLNSQLKKTQSEFLKIQEDFDAAKERDKGQYYNIVERIRDMYHESGTRHKLMKKVFLLLHEELLTIKRRILDFAETYSSNE